MARFEYWVKQEGSKRWLSDHKRMEPALKKAVTRSWNLYTPHLIVEMKHVGGNEYESTGAGVRVTAVPVSTKE
jgi:hypothetical protein